MLNTLERTPPKNLIVEDEVQLADSIRLSLEARGYFVTGNAISYGEAMAFYREQSPDLVLLDIGLNGRLSGIDFARFPRKQADPRPFIYLTSRE